MKQTKLQKFINILALLSSRDIEIINLRYNKKKSLGKIGEMFNITKERARQILRRVEKTIKRELE